jgi:hypothetical protein
MAPCQYPYLAEDKPMANLYLRQDCEEKVAAFKPSEKVVQAMRMCKAPVQGIDYRHRMARFDPGGC